MKENYKFGIWHRVKNFVGSIFFMVLGKNYEFFTVEKRVDNNLNLFFKTPRYASGGVMQYGKKEKYPKEKESCKHNTFHKLLGGKFFWVTLCVTVFVLGLFLTVYVYKKEHIEVNKVLGVVGTEITKLDSPEISAEVESVRTEASNYSVDDLCKGRRAEIAGAIRNAGVYCFSEDARLVDLITAAGGVDTDIVDYFLMDMMVNQATIIENGRKYYIPRISDSEKIAQYIDIDDTDYSSTDDAKIDKLSTDLKKLKYRYDYIDSEISKLSDALTDYIEEDRFSDSDINEPVEDDNNDSSNNSNTSNCININTATLEELDSLVGVGVSTANKIIAGRPYTKLVDVLNVNGIGQSFMDNNSSTLCQNL